MTARFAVVFAVCAGALTACSNDAGGPTAPVPTPKAVLAQSNFADCDELREYYARNRNRLVTLADRCWGCDPDDWQGGPADPATASGSGEPGEMSVPQVTVADVATGRFYVAYGRVAIEEFVPGGFQVYASHNELVTVRAVPAETMAVVSRQDVTGSAPYATVSAAHRLYLDSAGRRLVLVTQRTDSHAQAGYWRYPVEPWLLSAEVLFFDITDPDLPRLTDRYQIAGRLMAVRRIGQRLHLVTSEEWRDPRSLVESPEFDRLYSDYADARERNSWTRWALAAEIQRRIGDAVRTAPLEELLPVWRQAADPAAPFAPVACTQISRSELDGWLGFTSISSINMNGSDLAQVTAAGYLPMAHLSDGNAYLKRGSSAWWWRPEQAQQTAIYRYRLADAGPAQPAGYGVVEGWLPGPLSEHAGHLRAFTVEQRHDFAQDRWDTATHLFVLEAGSMEVVGQLSDFAWAAAGPQFIGDRALIYASVYARLAFDLADPLAPRLAGSLDVPYSGAYLRPYGDDDLLGVGFEVSGSGHWVHLMKFDVSDLAATQQVADVPIVGAAGERTHGEVVHYPEALTVHGDVVVLPVRFREPAPGFDDVGSGFVAYRVTQAGFTEVGRVDHGIPDPWLWGTPPRAVLLDEPGGRTVLYTLSNDFLKADAVGETLTPIASLPLQ